MKAQMKLGTKTIIEAEGSNVKEVIQGLSDLSEFFANADKCGKCESPNIKPQVRTPQGYVYYELLCMSCGAVLSFGQHKETETLFAKTHDQNRNLLPDGGWNIYQGNQGDSGDGPPPQQQQRPQQQAPRQQSMYNQAPAGRQQSAGDPPF